MLFVDAALVWVLEVIFFKVVITGLGRDSLSSETVRTCCQW